MPKDNVGKHALYFEATLQLREISEKVVDFVESEIVRKKISVARRVRLKNGFDYYLSDKELTKQLGRSLKNKFGGDYKTTASLWGQKKGQEVYRITVLFREIAVKVGDIVEYKDEEYRIKMLSKDIFLQGTKAGKKVHVKFKDMAEIKLKKLVKENRPPPVTASL